MSVFLVMNFRLLIELMNNNCFHSFEGFNLEVWARAFRACARVRTNSSKLCINSDAVSFARAPLDLIVQT